MELEGISLILKLHYFGVQAPCRAQQKFEIILRVEALSRYILILFFIV
jgi:hypothetical protein